MFFESDSKKKLTLLERVDFSQKYPFISHPLSFFGARSVLCMKFYSLGLGVMRRGQRAGGLGHTRSLLAQTGLQTADPAAALSLLISKPLF